MSDHELEAERAVLGSILLTGNVDQAHGLGLRPEHFARREHGLVFAAMLQLRQRGSGVDPLTVTYRLTTAYNAETGQTRLAEAGGRAAIDELTACAPVVGNLADYVRIVLGAAEWRSRKLQALALLEACQARDHAAYARALNGDGNVVEMRRAS